MKNPAIDDPKRWTDGDLEFTEVIRQEYSNCQFSAGTVAGHPVDTVYLQAKKEGIITTQLLLRPDELAAIGWVAAGTLWSILMPA